MIPAFVCRRIVQGNGMETESFTTIDYQTAYLRALTAARAGFTIILLLTAALFWAQFASVPKYLQFFDNVVSGKEAMPNLTKLVLNYYEIIGGLAAFLGLAVLLYIWTFGRSVSRVIFAGTAATVGLLVISVLIHLSCFQHLMTVLQ